MAYLRPIENPKCNKGCGKRATDELITYRNERYGFYCLKHANEMLEWLKREELRRCGPSS